MYLMEGWCKFVKPTTDKVQAVLMEGWWLFDSCGSMVGALVAQARSPKFDPQQLLAIHLPHIINHLNWPEMYHF